MKKIKIISILSAIMILLGGCGTNSTTKNSDNSKSTAAASSIDLSKVTIKVAETGWRNWEEELKAAGLYNTPYKVEYSVFQGGNLCLEAMAAGHIDFTGSSEIPPIFASQSANNGNFKIIAISNSNTLNQELVIPKGSTIKSVADLKGKKVAYVTNTTAHYFLIKMLEKAGLTWNDITPVQLSVPDGLTALIGGKVDALASYGNAIISAKQNGATTLESAKDILSGNFPYEATPEAIKDPGKHAAIVDFLTRLQKANEWARKNQQKWAEITAANTHQPVDQALAIIKEGEAQRSTKIIPVSESGIASEQDIADIFLKVGLIKNKVDVSKFWSNDFNDEIKKISE